VALLKSSKLPSICGATKIEDFNRQSGIHNYKNTPPLGAIGIFIFQPEPMLTGAKRDSEPNFPKPLYMGIYYSVITHQL